jgi:predicted aspartyl protease
MGRIVATVDVQNVAEPRISKKLDALVGTGASYLTLPRAWKEHFGSFEAEEVIELQTATQESIKGTVCGPVRVQVEGFRAIYNEVLFIDMEPEDGEFEPLLGYIALEQCGAAVDLVGHRLLPVRYMDAKVSAKRSPAPVLELPAQPRPVGMDRGMDVPARFFEPLDGKLLDAFEGDDEPA